VVITINGPGSPAPGADHVVLDVGEGRRVTVQRPPGCRASAEQLQTHVDTAKRTGDATDLMCALVPATEVQDLAEACRRSVHEAVAWRVPAARGNKVPCETILMPCVDGQDGRLEIIRPVELAAHPAARSAMSTAASIFKKIMLGLLAPDGNVERGLFDLLGRLVAGALT
jgi:hypothetical protein